MPMLAIAAEEFSQRPNVIWMTASYEPLGRRLLLLSVDDRHAMCPTVRAPRI